MRITIRLAALVGAALVVVPSASAASWPSYSQDMSGNRYQAAETTINPSNVGQLAPKWRFTTHGDVSATPTVSSDGAVYFPDWGGYMNAVNATTGALIWQRTIASYGGQGASRNAPLIVGNELIFGDNAGAAQPGGAHMFAVSRKTGALIWSTQVDSNPAAILTSSPVAADNEVVVGVASNEENDASVASYPCCSFRGAVVALNVNSGAILWKTYMVPSNNPVGGDSNLRCTSSGPPAGCGYTGAGVWASPTINADTNQVFVATGNNYTATDAATACANSAQSQSPPADDSNCTAPDDYFDSMVALNLRNGAIQWGHKLYGYDAWSVACFYHAAGGTWCPSPNSPDYDFGGSSPNLITATSASGQTRTLVGDGQKSGEYWALDPSTGSIVWNQGVGPGSSLGGLEWGNAYDGSRIYVAEANLYQEPYTLADGTSATGGSWAALNPNTGAFDWQDAVPGNYMALGPVSAANGVTFVSSMDPSRADPTMFALDSSTGKILWSYASGASVNAGPAIVNGVVYWGSGYGHLGPYLGSSGNTFYAFSLNGN